MTTTVFNRTYEHYLSQIRDLDLPSLAPTLGAETEGDNLIIPFFSTNFTVSHSGICKSPAISENSEKRAPFGVSVVLLKYILMCPTTEPLPSSEWLTFKDFRDAAPLLTYFKSNATGAVETKFSGQLKLLESACLSMKATPSPMFKSSYNLSMMFHALPKLPVILNFNDRDDEFPALCSILYQKNTASYLDMECVAITGTYLAGELIKRASES